MRKSTRPRSGPSALATLQAGNARDNKTTTHKDETSPRRPRTARPARAGCAPGACVLNHRAPATTAPARPCRGTPPARRCSIRPTDPRRRARPASRRGLTGARRRAPTPRSGSRVRRAGKNSAELSSPVASSPFRMDQAKAASPLRARSTRAVRIFLAAASALAAARCAHTSASMIPTPSTSCGAVSSASLSTDARRATPGPRTRPRAHPRVSSSHF